MGQVIHANFGTEREWQQTHDKTADGLVTVGALFGDAESLMRAKADCVYQILRQIVEDVPAVQITTKMPENLSEEQVRMLTDAIKQAALRGIEVAMTHSVQVLMSSIYDLCTASQLQKFMPMLTTAAGTIRPAQVLVIGAGVAGLQAIATARRLGAVVEAYDVRSATKEQVKSLGAKFVDTGVSAEGQGGYARELTAEEKAKQQEVLDSRIAVADAVVTTASVPGRAAPKIISRAAVERMRPGSVVVDIAAEQGGNCELTRAGETVDHNGVSIVGPLNLPGQLAYNASEMYSRNLLNFLKPALDKGELKIDWNDEVFAQACLTHDGAIKHEPTRKSLESNS